MLPVIFENEHFVVVDKPAGWLSVPGREGEADPRPCVSRELRKNGRVAFPVHRLDVEVSGLVLVAKTPEAHRTANGWFESRSIHKHYEALTEGKSPVEPGPLLWESCLVRGKRRTFAADHGKPAATRAHWLRSLENVPGCARAQLWLLEPLTGRPHQLRYELAHHGSPILGDALYGAKAPWREGAIALRAIRLDFSRSPEATTHGLPPRLEVEGLLDG